MSAVIVVVIVADPRVAALEAEIARLRQLVAELTPPF